MSAWHYIAQRATTGELLTLELPLARDELTWTLSGAGALRGTVAPDIGTLRAEDGHLLLEEWGTLLYAEADGQIRWGGILVSSDFQDEAWHLEAAGFLTYPHGLIYTGKDYEAVQRDPADIVRDLWAHVQDQPDGDLGVTVEGRTPVRLGETEKQVSFVTGDDEAVSFEEGPYRLAWADSPDVGEEIDSLAKETPFDYVESHAWREDDTIAHTVTIGHPRLGKRRSDLVFRDGENILTSVTVKRDGDDFANVVVGLGAGDGKAALHRSTGRRDGRLRRTAVYTDKGVHSARRMDARIRDELHRRGQLLTIDSVTVRDHPNAPIGSWALGDDIHVEVTVPWLGELALWCRVVEWSLETDDTATLKLARSDSFAYGG